MVKSERNTFLLRTQLNSYVSLYFSLQHNVPYLEQLLCLDLLLQCDSSPVQPSWLSLHPVPWVVNQEAVVLDPVKLTLSYMVLPLCSVVSFQVLWSLSAKSDFCTYTSHTGFWHPQYCRASQSSGPIIEHYKELIHHSITITA